MDQALEILPSDYWRWWLLANIPETADSDFTWPAFQAGVNKDLADVLGNFVSRVTKFCRSRFGEAVPEGEYGAPEAALIETLAGRVAAYTRHWEAIEIRRAAAELRAIWVEGNEYLQRAAPWAVVKEDLVRAGGIIRCALNLVRLYAILSRPFVPGASDAMLRAMNVEGQALDWPEDVAAAMRALPPGHGFTVPDNLFAKIEDAARDRMAERFAGAA
jgi:methionyl-tRNA synthetase